MLFGERFKRWFTTFQLSARTKECNCHSVAASITNVATGWRLLWLVAAAVCLLAAPRVQFFFSVGSGWLHNTLWYHWLMPISCHFWDCKGFVVTSLIHLDGHLQKIFEGWAKPLRLSPIFFRRLILLLETRSLYVTKTHAH